MKISVNAEKTIQNFSSVLTDPTKVLSELIQNARRAGATRIEIEMTQATDTEPSVFKIIDNGVGISDFNKLFTLSESGWSADNAPECPFGMGFFSVFYAAEHVTIESCGNRIALQSSSALNFEDFGEPELGVVPVGYTKIALSGVKFSTSNAEWKIKDLARHSSVDIYLNGGLLPSDLALRHYAQVGTALVESPFGTLVMGSPFSEHLTVVLQDLKIYTDGHHYERNVLFSQTLKARMPDRDRLINEFDVIVEIKQWLAEHYRVELAGIRAVMANDVAFLDAHYDAVLKFSPKTLLEIDYLPAQAFFEVEYPSSRYDDVWLNVSHESGLFKADAANHFCCLGGFDLEYHPVAANFVYFAKAYIIKHALPEGHWFVDACDIPLGEDSFNVVATEAITFDYFLPYNGGGQAVVAKSLSIEHVTGLRASVVNGGMLTHANDYIGEPTCARIVVDDEVQECAPTIMISGSFDSRALLLQVNSYGDGDEGYDETALDADAESFDKQYIAATGGDVETILSSLLGTLPPVLIQRLQNKAYTLEVDDKGTPTFKKAA